MMESLTTIGWQIHHKEHLYYQSNSGIPEIWLKFFHYPSYRQTVRIEKFPNQCKLKSKGINSFFIYQHKIGTKGIVSLDRVINVSLRHDWGKISEYPLYLQKKYKQSSKYWPTTSTLIKKVADETWFEKDNLREWIQYAYNYVTSKIKNRENQDKRLGADYAFFQGIGDCDEFTDLFITIARMRGIPCRRLTGFHIKQKKKICAEGHAWAEILSPKKEWITIDIALNNIAKHSINYIILKIEEFNPSLSDYQVKSKQAKTCSEF